MKNEQPKPEKISLIVPGVVIFAGWILVHVIYVAYLFMCLVFTSPATGRDLGKPPLSETTLNVLFYGTCIGLIVSTLAGVPLFLAVALPWKRMLMFLIFLGMLAAGVIIQIGAWQYSYAN